MVKAKNSSVEPTTKKKKSIGPAHCRGCSSEVSRDPNQHVKIGGKKYHPNCAAIKPKVRQRWDSELGWVRL